MAVQDYKINYKSDFVLTINGDAGWAVPFCIKFWTGMPSQAYFVGFDGMKYINCRVGDTPTQLMVMFDDHHLSIGKLMMQIAYHTTIEEFPGSVFDEVTNARDVIVTIDGTDYQVMLDFTGEDAPELEFDLPAYANEAERIQNELQRQQNEAARIAAELQREQATAAAVQGAENVNAQLNGTTLTVTNRQGVSTSVNTKGEQGPVGPEGPQGEQGVSIVSFRQVYASETATYYVITFSDGHEQSVAIPKGAKGDTGATGPTGPQGPQGQTGVSITGFVETGETETATLYNITFSNGTTQQVAIPKGEKGDQGEQGPEGPQGPMGDVAVITPEQQAAFTMYNTTGQNTDGPMTQKAVTDNLVAGSISYDNSASGLAAGNVQGALDEVSSNIPLLVTNGNDGNDLDIADFVGNILASFKNGHLETKECSWVIDTSGDGLFIADSNGNILAWLIAGNAIMGNFNTAECEFAIVNTILDGIVFADDSGNIAAWINGGILTQGFDSFELASKLIPNYYGIELPVGTINVYNVCNNLNTSGQGGIGSRNYGNSVYLDHFIKSSAIEKTAKFDKNNQTYYNFSQKIGSNWNGGVNLLSTPVELTINGGDKTMNVINRQVLNSATSSLFPKVLQIGDSVTEGWLANYPTMENAPIASWSWAKYFFQKDNEQKGSGFNSLFIGTSNKIDVTYDNVSVKGFAEGRGGWTPQDFWETSSIDGKNNPFYDSTLQHFSLQTYLNKYKTLDDDGVTRLVVGSTAGTSVTNVNAYDVCTPNVIVLQLGMNGTLAIWRTYMVNIIQQIKSEFPNMKIILSVIDTAICMFPSLYPQYDGIFLTDHEDAAHSRMIDIMKWAIDTLPTQTYTANGNTYEMTEANGIYVIYTGAIMPMPYSVNVREIVNPLSTLQEGLKRYVGIENGRQKHPSRFGHEAMGYEMYSAIKWVLMH